MESPQHGVLSEWKGRPSTCENTGYPSCARIPLRMILLFWLASAYSEVNIRYVCGMHLHMSLLERTSDVFLGASIGSAENIES